MAKVDKYIKREDALNMVNHVRDKCGNEEMTVTLNWVIALLNNIPAADVVEVKRGRWTMWDDGEGDTYECSACGEVWTLNAGTPKENNMHYCPNCGAKMEGDGE